MEPESYTYTELPPGKWLRLLRIPPALAYEPLKYEILLSHINDAPPYKALSYAWGDIRDTTVIDCSGTSQAISAHLHSGLCRVRHTTKPLVIWVDAICINQMNNIEKGLQVDFMSTIYEQAEEVIVWFGDVDDRSGNLAFGTITKFNCMLLKVMLEHTRDDDTNEAHASSKHSTCLRYAFDNIKDNAADCLEEGSLVFINALYSLPWFQRVWVLQEIGVANKATALWGYLAIPFSELALFIYFVASIPQFAELLGKGIAQIILGSPYFALYNIWSTYGKAGWIRNTPILQKFSDACNQWYIDFILVLEGSKRFKATNPLDHVYAFLGHPKAISLQTK